MLLLRKHYGHTVALRPEVFMFFFCFLMGHEPWWQGEDDWMAGLEWLQLIRRKEKRSFYLSTEWSHQHCFSLDQRAAEIWALALAIFSSSESPGMQSNRAPLLILFQKNIKRGDTHCSSSFIIVPIHGRASIWTVFSGICKLSWDKYPEVSIFTAASPFPSFTRWSLMVWVTATNGGSTFSTWPCDSKCHTSRGNGMHKSWFSCGCKRVERPNLFT